VPYADPLKRAECARKACRRYYRRYRDKELLRAARYRQSNRRLVARRQRAWTRKKVAEDPTWHCRTALQTDWKRRCQRKGIFHSEPFLELLGMLWEQFTRRLERQVKRRGWDWSDYGSEFTIDHRLPCCAFDPRKAEQRAMCSHWSNLQVFIARRESQKERQLLQDRAPVLQNAMAFDIRTSASANAAVQRATMRTAFLGLPLLLERQLVCLGVLAPGTALHFALKSAFTVRAAGRSGKLSRSPAKGRSMPHRLAVPIIIPGSRSLRLSQVRRSGTSRS
jgi:hypothetical protein